MRTAGYSAYTRQLRLLAADVARGSWGPVEQDVHQALNGQASEQVRALVPLQVRRDEGAYFTGGPVRARFAQLLDQHRGGSSASQFWDPACGAGDLLIAASDRLPTGASLADTIQLWGRLLRGCDLHKPFVEAARLRLFLAAAARHRGSAGSAGVEVQAGLRAFRGLRTTDGLVSLRATTSYQGNILLNPPYAAMSADASCDWGSGSVSQAAVFLLAGIQALRIGQKVFAVLPDVLRSGSRYSAFRSRVEEILEVERVDPYGQFDAQTDIDVFLLAGRRRRKSGQYQETTSWWPQPMPGISVDDAFEVRVGSVVDNRDPHTGPVAPFLTARDLSTLKDGSMVTTRRQFVGRLVSPPFVAIRRTSRPGVRAGGEARAAGVLVTGLDPVAVDNHLITASPRSGAEADCKKLLDVLDSPAVTEWLDQRIRCRHLTVGVVRSLPWNGPASTPESN